MHKILVVESKASGSEQSVDRPWRTALVELGYEVLCSGTEQVSENTELNDFDLVIIDGLERQLKGINLFQTMRRTNPTLVGILLVDDTCSELVIDAMDSGFSRVCRIPIKVEKLVKAVEDTLQVVDMRDDISRMKVLLPLYNLGQNFLAAESEQEVYRELIDAVSRELHAPSVSLLMFEAASHSLKVAAYRGLASRYLEGLEIKPGEQIAGRVFLSGQPVVLNKAGREQNPYNKLMKRDEISSAICFPVAGSNKVLGVLNISETKNGSEYTEADIEMLSIIVGQAVMALDNIRSIQAREESSRLKAIFEQYVSPEVSHLLVENRKDLLDVGGVQQLTVLFADIRNFTLLVQHLEPGHLRLFLNSFFDMFSDIVFSYRGMLDKFMGDAALVIFGAPVQVVNPNNNAVQVAQKIVVEFEKLRLLWEKQHGVFQKIGLGIGISRGEMFLGNVGSSKRLDYTVIGADVNIAQRLASVTDSGQILLTDRVVATLDKAFPIKKEEAMLLRGMESTVDVYSLSPPSL